MADAGELITHVSDTARWVAAYRAQETMRSRPLFRDPLADRMAGPRGHEIAAKAPLVMRNGWSIIARTKLIDDLILASLREDCDLVVNLAAGLDTRPYRMDLPRDLVWVEADLPDVIAEKDAALAAETPRCTLIRRAVDLADTAARGSFLDEVLTGGKALVLTEGLLLYLSVPTVAELAKDLDRPGVTWWLANISRYVNRMRVGKAFTNAPVLFEPPNGLAFFEELGWHPVDVQPLLPAARRFRRAPWFLLPYSLLPQPDPYGPARSPWNAVIRMRADR